MQLASACTAVTIASATVVAFGRPRDSVGTRIGDELPVSVAKRTGLGRLPVERPRRALRSPLNDVPHLDDYQMMQNHLLAYYSHQSNQDLV